MMNEATLVVDHRRLVNNELSNPDVLIVVDEKNTLTAHSYVLAERIPTLFEDNVLLKKKKIKKKKQLTVIELNKNEQVTTEAVQRLLSYAYSGVIDYKTFTPFKAVEVLRVAVPYKVERLCQLCQKYLQSTINIDNIFRLLKYTDTMNVERAKQICMEFALWNADFFTSASAESLGFKLYQEVTTMMLKAQNQKTQPTEIQLTEDTIVEDFKRIYENDSTKDFSLTIHNEEVKVHRAFLTDLSSELTAFINQDTDSNQPPNTATRDSILVMRDKESKENIMNKDITKRNNHTNNTAITAAATAQQTFQLKHKYPHLSPRAFDTMLRFLYYTQQDIPMLHACQLFLFSKEMNLTRLSQAIEKSINNEEITVTTALPVLDVAFTPIMSENPELQKKLKENGLKFVIRNVDKIDFLPLQKMAPQIGTQILQHLQYALSGCWTAILQNSTGSNPNSNTTSPRTALELVSPSNYTNRDESPRGRLNLDILSVKNNRNEDVSESCQESERSCSKSSRSRGESRSKSSRKESTSSKKKKKEQQ